MNAEDKSAYNKGYVAGRKKTEKEIARYDTCMAEEMRAYRERRDRIFCAALQGMLAGNKTWTSDDHTVTTMAQYVELALKFAHAAATKLSG